MACKWLTVLLSDLDYNTPRCRQNIVFVESEVIGSEQEGKKIFPFFEHLIFTHVI